MFKQRLVGFIVLGALAIIFWPIVFVSPEPDQELMLPVFEMPERPDVVMSERREPMLERVDRSRLPVIERAELPEDSTIDAIATDPKMSWWLPIMSRMDKWPPVNEPSLTSKDSR